MLSYQVYKILHLGGLFAVFMSLGALVIHGMNGGERLFDARKWVIGSFVTGMVVSIVAGFGMLARLGASMEPWVFAKLGLWLVVGGYLTFIQRKPALGRVHWLTLLAFVVTGAALALYKP